MTYLKITKAGIAVNWVDGYLPPRQELIRNIRNYPNSRSEFNQSHLDYEPASDWPRKEIFESAAFFITSDFHNRNQYMPYQRPCYVWLAKLCGEGNPHAEDIAYETKTDPRRKDYFHIVSVHNIDEASQCLSHLLDNIGFEIKDDCDYQDLKMFRTECEHAAYEILKVFSAPHFVADDIFRGRGFDIFRPPFSFK